MSSPEEAVGMTVAALVARGYVKDAEADQVRLLLTTLVSEVRVHQAVVMPSVCIDCPEKLDEQLMMRCPKHAASFMATEYAKGKAREHGPLLVAKAADALSSWLAPAPKPGEKKQS